jgi:mono/diheme cytochrome c family protein
VAYVSTPEAWTLGKYLFESRGCGECHGADGAGRAFIKNPDGSAMAISPNITASGAVAKYTESDWVRAIRHGLKPGGKPVFFMPSQDYNRLTDGDLAALVAYIRSLAPVNGEVATFNLPLPVKALYALGKIPDAAEIIDHRVPPAKPVEVAVSVEHGQYVAQMCAGCHGANYSGGPIPGTPSSWPAASNLTPGAGSAMVKYDAAEKFVAMMRTGKRPDGSAVSNGMPFEALRVLNDTDSNALYAYLKTLPARDAGGR